MEAHSFFFMLCCAAALLLAGAQTGFISIDCGLIDAASYVDPYNNLTYVSDEGFIEGGVNVRIKPGSLGANASMGYYTVRSFPNYTRNCYQLPAAIGFKYYVRAAFLYGNYDGRNQTPSFDLYLGANLWDTVKLDDNVTPFRTELVVQAETSHLSVCLVGTGRGTPFISALKLREVPQNMYAPANSSLSLALKTFKRVDVGATRYISYPYDTLDRIWEPDNNVYGTPCRTSEEFKDDVSLKFGLPSVVMQTAVCPTDEISVNWTAGGVEGRFFLLLEFADVLGSQAEYSGRLREMKVRVNGVETGTGVRVFYDQSSTLPLFPLPVNASQVYSVSIRSANASDEGPVLNSFEVYEALTFIGSAATDGGDVDVLGKIKTFYNIKKNWMGDPCFPVCCPWDGLTCDGAPTPQIVTLDLSNCGINDTIFEQISKLASLRTLNLSRNNLNGSVPDSLENIQNLSIIDLSYNNLSGSIPPRLQEKIKNKGLKLRIDGNPLMRTDQEDGKGRKKTIVAVSTVVSLVVVSLILFFVFAAIKHRKHGAPPPENEGIVHSLLRQHGNLGSSKSGTFTHSEVVEMTNNFEKVIGKGGSGIVFYGHLRDGREVAVKKVSSTILERGIKEFAAEVTMLMQVHHRYLIPFIGYCADKNEMILIYEYMPKGNLQKLLSDETADSLNWQKRLQIALDAAIGIEYLHSRCKPAIIHRDVKSSNILITEKFEAKIADFGLSKSVDSDEITHVTTAIAGTAGYLDPEYCYTNNLTAKSDVYSFGVVLFELITGRTAISIDVEGQRVPLVLYVRPILMRGDIQSIIDLRLQGEYDINSIRKVADTALTCTEEKSVLRPTMMEVVAELKDAMKIEQSRERSGSWRMEASFTSSSSFVNTSASATSASDTSSSFYPSTI